MAPSRPAGLPNLSRLHLQSPSPSLSKRGSASIDAIETFRTDREDWPADYRFDEVPPDDGGDGVVKGDALSWMQFEDGQRVIVLDTPDQKRIFDLRNLSNLLRAGNTRRLPRPYDYQLTDPELRELGFTEDEIRRLDLPLEGGEEADPEEGPDPFVLHLERGPYDSFDGPPYTDLGGDQTFESLDEATRETLWQREEQRIMNRVEDLDEWYNDGSGPVIALQTSSARARGNWDIVMSAVTQDGMALEHASRIMRAI